MKDVQMGDDKINKGLTSMLYGLVTVGMMLLMPLVHKGSKNTTGVLNETISLTEDHFCNKVHQQNGKVLDRLVQPQLAQIVHLVIQYIYLCQETCHAPVML